MPACASVPVGRVIEIAVALIIVTILVKSWAIVSVPVAVRAVGLF
jgi:hypothetical protein